MTSPSNSAVQNLLPVQAYFDAQDNFLTFIGQGKPFYATVFPDQSGLNITNSTINSTTIGLTVPAAAIFTDLETTTGRVLTQPVGATDMVNLLALQSYAAGISWKQPCAVATLAPITLSGLQTIDSYTTLAGDRVLVKNEANAAFNGIYLASAGAWTRSLDADQWTDFVSAITFIEYGTQAGGAWFCTAVPGGTLNVTPLNWSQFTTSATYSAGTGLTLTGSVFSITNTGATAGTYGSASRTITQTVNAQGQITNIFDQPIDIAASQIGSGTIDTARISGSYTGITGVGTLVAGTWNAGTIGVAYGGTGATTLTGYVKGSGTTAFTASSTIPTTDLSGTITNAQLVNSTISGVALGGNLFNLTAGTNITFSSGTTYNGSAAITINATVPSQVYPGAGIANSTGTSWGTSYTTTGSGTVVALATSPSFTTPILGTPTSGNFSTGTFTWPTFNQNTTGTAAGLSATLVVGSGGTGSTSLAANNVLLGNGTSALQTVAPGTSGNVLTSNGTTWTSTSLPATGLSIVDDTTTNATRYITFTSATSGNITTENVSSTKLQYNPSTGALSATKYFGDGSSLTGIVSGATISNDTSTASNLYPLFSSATSGTPTTIYTSNAKYLYKPSTGDLYASQLNASNGLVLNATTLVTSYTIPVGSSAHTVGGSTGFNVPSGMSVTVSSGSRWLVQ